MQNFVFVHVSFAATADLNTGCFCEYGLYSLSQGGGMASTKAKKKLRQSISFSTENYSGCAKEAQKIPTPAKSTGTNIQCRNLQPADIKARITKQTRRQSSPLAGVTRKETDVIPEVGATRERCNAQKTCPMSKADEKMKWETNTILLTYLTVKLESINANLRAKAEECVLLNEKQLDNLYKMLHEKKRQAYLTEKEREVEQALDLQIATLTPVAKVANQFTNYYSSLATDLVNIQHQLCVNKFYISGNKMEFLDEAESFLRKSEDLLVEFKGVDKKETDTSLECLKQIKTTSKKVNQQLAGAFSVLLELYSLACRHSMNVQLAKEEEQLGVSRSRDLFCTKQ